MSDQPNDTSGESSPTDAKSDALYDKTMELYEAKMAKAKHQMDKLRLQEFDAIAHARVRGQSTRDAGNEFTMKQLQMDKEATLSALRETMSQTGSPNK